ncbi:MAG: sulfite exporter TauE/SafE family protein [Planctomycetes bacterium]|nr:sulfite exporter TauE/SafE family protein [Planctomycetota bacterium]
MFYYIFIGCISWLAGFLGGLTGTGGIIMPPLLVEFFGISPHLAMATVQASYVVPCILAVYLFARKGQLDLRIALAMAVPGCISSFIAADSIKPRLDPTLLTMIYSLCIVISGAVMLRRNPRTRATQLVPPWRLPVLAVLGAVIGVMAGITGSGTNSVLVPIMVFLGLDLLTVLAACQVFAILASASGTVGNLLHLELDFAAIAWMTAVQMVGIWYGVRLAQRLDTTRLKRYVGIVCFFAGVFIFLRALYGLW